MLYYEAAVKGWLPAALPIIQADPYFSKLALKNIQFIDINLMPTPIFKKKTTAPENDSFDSDDDVYHWFEFRESDENYLGRRSSHYSEEEDDDEMVEEAAGHNFDDDDDVLF